ncbi:MAG TPA: universal stress protein [Bacteroidia bacterium]|nr:universal stress protein [Bacteroidia bacterium]
MAQQKILLATDYSEAAMSAERYAVQLALRTDSALVLLHVWSRPVMYPADAVSFAVEADVRERDEMRKLEMYRERLLHAFNVNEGQVNCTCVTREGINVGKQIREAAKELQADFIVAGTHGASGFRETFLGTHAWDVIRKTDIPVFAIPRDTVFSGINRIVFGTSYREEEFSVLNFLTRFAERFNAKLTILHVTNFVLTEKFENEMFQKFRDEIKTRFEYRDVDTHLLESDSVEHGLKTYCAENKTDILAMSIPQSSFFEKFFLPGLSMTKKMSLHTQIPLLVVPASADVAPEVP